MNKPPTEPHYTSFEGELAPPPDPRKPRFTTFEESAMDNTKFAALSKLNWLGLATAILPMFVPAVQELVAAHPGAAGAIVGTLTVILRTFFTSTAVTLKPNP